MLKFPALKINQHGKEIYTFKTIGKDILSFASIDRIKRNEDGELLGYQRIEVTKHIKEIANYLENKNAILANSIVVCFDTHVKFELLNESNDFGYICIPKDKIYGQIVDGQQRSTALNNLQNEDFEVVVNAFITDDTDEQREQFLLINNTKPLPKPLIYELLPEVINELPSIYKDKKLPNKLVSILNNQPHSPFYHAIKTHTFPDGYLKDNTIIKTLTSSLTDGILYEFSEHELGMNDVESMTNIVNAFWGAVQKTFPKDWKLDPKKTRLTHGAGILALSNIMEEILYKNILVKNPKYLKEKSFITSDFEKYLEPLKNKIDWQKGKYDFNNDGNLRSIMDIQNTSKDIGLFKNFLSQQL
jgi:DNA sulfur modification protein DndB